MKLAFNLSYPYNKQVAGWPRLTSCSKSGSVPLKDQLKTRPVPGLARTRHSTTTGRCR